MNSLRILLKYTLINKLNLNKLFKNVKEKNLVILVVLALLSSLGIFAFATLYMFLLGQTFIEIGCVELLILMGLAFGTLMCFVSNIPMCDSTLFHSRDYEMLASMPVKTKDIIISKFLTLVLINYGMMGLLIFSSTLVVAVLGALTLPMFLLILVVFIFSPLLPLSLSAFCSFVFSKLTSKLKHKNLISTILTIAFVVSFMFISMSFRDLETDQTINAYAYILNTFKNMGYLPYLAFTGITGNYLNLIIYIVSSTAVFTLFFMIVSLNYNKINSDLKTTYKNENFEMEKEKNSNVNLLSLELRKYFNLSGYVLNTIIGPIMGTVVLIVLMMQGLDTTIIAIGGDSYLALVVVALVCIFTSITPTTAATISLEGKHLWILKSMPIETKKILEAKVMVSVLTSIPFQIINGLLVFFVWKCSLLDLAFIILIPSLFSICMSYLGLYINLKAPRFDWDNPIKIVKNSTSVLITMLSSAIIYIVTGIIAIVLMVLGVYVYLILGIMAVILLGLLIICIKLVHTKGISLFEGLIG